MTRICVLRAGAVGDTIVSFPVLIALRRHLPAARIVFVGRSEARHLAREAGLADEVLHISDACFAPLAAGGAADDTWVRAFFGGFDLVVSLLSDSEGAIAARLRGFGARHVLSFRGERQGLSIVAQLQEVLADIGAASVRPEEAVIHLPGGRPCGLPARFWVMHPGSGSPAKNWPPAHFSAVAAAVSRAGMEIVMLRGDADDRCVAEVSQGLSVPVTVIAAPLEEVALLLAGATGYLGNDSGISHCAGILGIPTCAVFGPTDAVVWRPCGPRVRVVRGRDGAFPEVRQVIAALSPGDACDSRSS